MHEIIGYIFFSPQEDDVRYPGPRGGGGGEGNGRELGQRNQVKQVYTLYTVQHVRQRAYSGMWPVESIKKCHDTLQYILNEYTFVLFTSAI